MLSTPYLIYSAFDAWTTVEIEQLSTRIINSVRGVCNNADRDAGLEGFNYNRKLYKCIYSKHHNSLSEPGVFKKVWYRDNVTKRTESETEGSGHKTNTMNVKGALSRRTQTNQWRTTALSTSLHNEVATTAILLMEAAKAHCRQLKSASTMS